MGHLAAPPEKRCGEVSGTADEHVQQWLLETPAAGKRILEKDTNVQLKSFLKSTLKPL